VPERLGLVSDFGGVLTTNVFDSFRAFCAGEGLEPEALTSLFSRDHAAREAIVALETGRIDVLDFETQLGAFLGVDGDTLVDRLFSTLHVDERMLGAVAELHDRGIRTCLLSNSWGTGIYARATRVMGVFDANVISGEVGLRKPDPAIYRLALERIGLAAEQCVFLDDLPFNLPPAEELGMAAVHHVGPEQTLPELERLFGIRLGGSSTHCSCQNR
jgi:putative hydrolase of the HAD superfamily